VSSRPEMRALFAAYVLVIAAGLALYITIGLMAL
jgi:hypothetical protein